MSASSKKKLRNEQQSAKLTERQLAEQKEAKKLKLYTAIFVVVLAVLLVVALVFGVTNTISSSGIREKKTIALTVGNHEINNAEYNYYFIDAINSVFSGDNAYMVQLGLLDATQPLDQQVNPFTGENWADYIKEYANQSIKSTYALVDAANAAGFTMTDETALNVENVISNQTMYAAMYGYTNVDAFLKASYGNGASLESYRAYVENSMLAQDYYNQYSQDLTYEDADLRALEAEDFNKFSSYTYNYYYLNASKFLEGGTTDAEGNTTYSDAEQAASLKACEEAAKSLVSEEITNTDELDAAIAALSINAGSDTPAASTKYENNLYTSIADEDIANWLADSSRKEGDLAYIANEITSTNSETNETSTSVNGYYVVYFHSVNDNTFALKNVRHILAAFEGGTYDSATGLTTYSDEEKAAAKSAAEDLLNQWKAGEASEDSFAALANEHSDDGNGTTGGLYEDIYPGQMVSAFNNWTFADGRQAGDTGIVETEYGYHVMYFCGDSDQSYRDYLITNELRSTDINNWYAELLDSAAITEGDTSYVKTDIVLNSGN